MPNNTTVPRPLIALIYNTAAMRSIDPELDLAKRTPGQVDNGTDLIFGDDCVDVFESRSPFRVDRNVRLTDQAIQHLGRVAAGLPPPARL